MVARLGGWLQEAPSLFRSSWHKSWDDYAALATWVNRVTPGPVYIQERESDPLTVITVGCYDRREERNAQKYGGTVVAAWPATVVDT